MGLSRGGRTRPGAVALSIVVGLLAACRDDDDGGGTLVPLDSAPGGSTVGVAPTGDTGATADTAVDPAQAGAGFVSIQVELPAAGVDETISLDRATVRADELDPVFLDATCTPLDGGTDVAVSVVDFRRLGTGARLVSAALTVAGGPTAGQHDVTVEISGADQVTTAYTGTIEVADGAMSGTFAASDAAGDTATGTFVCAPEPVATTTVPGGTGGGEVVPDSEAPDD